MIVLWKTNKNKTYTNGFKTVGTCTNFRKHSQAVGIYSVLMRVISLINWDL